MLIAGFQKMTLLDYPGKLAALVFTQGCNFACGYCHNPEMIPPLRILPEKPELDQHWILDFLKTRQGLLDGVVISGGEPTLQQDLVEFIGTIKALGFLVKLDTNGSHPEVLSKLIDKKWVDFIAMDIKHETKKYQELVKNDCLVALQESIRVIMGSPVDYEFRSTILPCLHTADDLHAMGRMIPGAKQWYLQNFRPLKTLDRKLQHERAFTSSELHSLLSIAKQYVAFADVRNDVESPVLA